MAFNLNKKARSINNKKPHGGKVKGFGLAAGDAENTGMPVTPAPTRKIAPDVISAPRAATEGHGYGMSPGNNPSVIPTGTQLLVQWPKCSAKHRMTAKTCSARSSSGASTLTTGGKYAT